MVKYGDIVDGDLTEYEYSDSEDSDSSVDETEDDEIQTNQYIRKCNMARTKLTDKKRRAALLRAKASEKSFGSEICDDTNDSNSSNENKSDSSTQNHINKTYVEHILQHELEPLEGIDDSMSCVYGRVKNGRDGYSFMGLVTDTGSGLPIISARYAEGLGLEFLPLAEEQTFEIDGAGGGKETMKYYVYLSFNLQAQLVTGANEQLDLTLDSDKKIQLSFHLRFFVMNNLKVPALWGGPESRNLEMTDHYQVRGITIKSPTMKRVYFIPTVSCYHLTSVLMR
jgi:hypothetical protein